MTLDPTADFPLRHNTIKSIDFWLKGIFCREVSDANDLVEIICDIERHDGNGGQLFVSRRIFFLTRNIAVLYSILRLN